MKFEPFRAVVVLLALALQLVGCSEPQCPGGYIKDGNTCRRCPRGMERVRGMCQPLEADGGAGSGAETLDGQAASDAAEFNTDSEAEDVETGAADDSDLPACVPKTEICGNDVDDDCDGEIDELSNRAEECNGIDDNCDGVVDEGLLAVQPHADIWPQSLEMHDYVQVAMLPRAGGGGWLLYRAGLAGSGFDNKARGITILGVNADGRPAGIVEQTQGNTQRTAHFIAEGDGQWVVIASRRVPLDGETDLSHSVQVQLFKADSLQFIGEHTAVRRPETTYTTYASPIAVSAFEDTQGAVNVLVAYVMDDGSSSNVDHLYLQTVKRAATGQWSSAGGFQLFEGGQATNVAMTRIPCREEWAVATASQMPASRRMGRYTPGRTRDGEIEAIPEMTGVGGVGHSEGSCDEDTDVVLVYTSSEGVANVRRWTIDRASGTFRRNGSDLQLSTNLLGANVRNWGGRWLISGTNSDGALTLVEVRFDSAEPIRYLRLLEVDGPNPGNIGITANFRGQMYGGVTSLLPLERELLVSAASAQSGNLTAILRGRQSTSDQAAAVTFHIGCM